MYTPQTSTGTVTGTGASLSVTLGFEPKYVKVINLTSGASLETISDVGDGKGLKLTDTPTYALVSSNGLTIDNNGFTLGTDAVNTNTDTLAYIAFG